MITSFIIVNYKSEKYLRECFASLFSARGGFALGGEADFEIIVINNSENNLNLVDINLWESDNAKIINNRKNIGFGRACNLGAKEARGKYLCFLNPDTIILSKNINEIIEEFKNNKEVGAIGPELIGEDGKTQWWCAGAEATFLDLIKNNLGFIASRKIWESRKKTEADWVSGAALFISRELFAKLKGFDENFFMYYEDIDLCRRVKNSGKKVIYFPAVKIKHFGGKSHSDKSMQKKEYYKSQDYYFQKHFGKFIASLIKLLRKFNQ